MKRILTNISISFKRKHKKYIILCVAAQVILPVWGYVIYCYIGYMKMCMLFFW